MFEMVGFRSDWNPANLLRPLPPVDLSHRPPVGRDGSIALHEAAHAVLALQFGCEVELISVRVHQLRGGGPGHCEWSSPPLAPLDCAAIYFAGGIADGTDFDSPQWGSNDDWLRIVALAAKEPDPDRFVMLASMRAGCLLRRTWPAVVELANALVRERSLTGEQAARICDAAMGRSKRP